MGQLPGQIPADKGLDQGPGLLSGRLKTLGLESLTLQDILDSMQHEDSPFRMFAAGHSQGGAVVQLWIDYLLRQGVKPDKLCGYGFASPSVCRRGYGEGPLPVILISNSDDIGVSDASTLH